VNYVPKSPDEAMKEINEKLVIAFRSNSKVRKEADIPYHDI